jgi:HSP20 family protein
MIWQPRNRVYLEAKADIFPPIGPGEVIVMVMRFDPFREVDRQVQQLANRMQESSGAMAMDAYRRGDTVFVHFDLPGVDADSIELTAEQNTLTVRADRRWTPEPEDQILAQERPQGAFMRQLMLGEHLDPQHVEAAYEDGVLTVEVPVAPAAKPRKIEIRGSGQRRGAIDVEAGSGGSKGNGSP